VEGLCYSFGYVLSLQEARTLTKARKLGVVTPGLYAVDLVTNTMTFEFVDGPLVKDILLKWRHIVVDRQGDCDASPMGA
jgi:tRNA A-37 threonylcarbamoyl transferase component Bud32